MAATNNIWMEILLSEEASAQTQFEIDGYEGYVSNLRFANTGIGPAEKFMISIWGADVPADVIDNIIAATSASSVPVGAWLTIDGSQVPGVAYDDTKALSHMPGALIAVEDIVRLSGQVLRDFTPPPLGPSGFSSGFSGGFN